MTEIGDRFYRFDYENWGDGSASDGSGISLYKHIWRVAKITPRGVWIASDYWRPESQLAKYGQRFILNDSRKKWAYPTELDAMKSFVIRKKRQIQYLASNHDNAVEALVMGEEALQKMIDGAKT